nr:VOC family protein [Aerococcus urinae]
MIGYVTLGSNDRQRAGAFYDELLGLLNAKRAMVDGDRLILWANGQGPMLGVIKPADGNAATVGNGNMVALAVGSRENVEKIHAKALALGGKDEGPVGLRGGNFYAG